MKTTLLAVLFALFMGRAAAAAPTVTVGGQVSTPEVFGLFLSVWPDSSLSVDGRLTLSSVDGGLSGHIPLAGSWEGGWRHDLVLTALVGWVGIPVWRQPNNGWRLTGMAGYGLLGTVDVRLEAGVTAIPGFGAGFTAMAAVGKTF